MSRVAEEVGPVTTGGTGEQVSVAEVAEWLVRELEFGVGMHTESLPPWLTVRDLAAAWRRLEGDGESLEDWVGTIVAETGWPDAAECASRLVPDAIDENPDHVLSVPTSQRTVGVDGYGTATVLEVAGAWNWGCNRTGCEVSAIALGSFNEADGDAVYHLRHEHEPLPAAVQQQLADITEETRP